MRLFHFSDDPRITTFVPRAIRVPAGRPAGFEWLNGPLVWAIDEAHEPMYLFPRECPRILIWATPDTTPEDREEWFGGRTCRMIAHIEQVWLDRLKSATLSRYEFPLAAFEDIHDAGMWVSRTPVESIGIDTLADLPAELQSRGVELRVMDSLLSLKNVWQTSLHASGIRLRNAANWGKPGWTHSKKGRPVILQ